MLRLWVVSICLGFAALVSAVQASPPAPPVSLNAAPGQPAADPREEVDVFLMLDGPAVIPQLDAAHATSDSGAIGKATLGSIEKARQKIVAEQDRVLRKARDAGLVLSERRRFDRLVNSVLIRTRRQHMDALRRLAGVSGVYENRRVQAMLHDSVPLIGADKVWRLTDARGRALSGEGTVVAIIDTGIDYTHPDLGGCFGPQCKVIGGWDFVNDDGDPRDDNFHGTHVAGIVAADGARKGVAPGARLLAYKVLSAEGWGTMDDIVAAIETAADPDGNLSTDDGADVINLSLGAPGGDPHDPLSVAVDNAVGAGAVVAVAAGNSGQYFGLGSPALAERAITVASSTKDDEISVFSSRGPLSVERTSFVKPEIVAPGSDIDSTVPSDGHERLNGTSMAAPHVAGAAALLRQLHPAHSPAAIKNLLIHAARPLDADIYTQGGGRLDVARAAANSRVTVDVGIVNHGWVDNTAPEWISPDRTLTFTNHGDTPLTLSIAAERGPTPGEVVWEQPESLELPPGGSRSITHRMRLDPRRVPFATTAALAHRSALRVTGGDVDLRVPVVFHHAPTLSLVLDNPQRFGTLVGLYREDQVIRWLYLVPAGQEAPSEIRVPPGRYTLVFAFGSVRYVVKEGIDIQDAAETVAVGFDEASHTVLMPEYRRADGGVVPHEDLHPALGAVVIEHEPTGVWFNVWGYPIGAPAMFGFSDVPDKFRIQGMTMVEDLGAPNADRQLYHSSFVYQGMHAGQELQLGPSTEAIRLRFDEASPARPITPITTAVFADASTLLPIAENGVISADGRLFHAFDAPFGLTFHMRNVEKPVDAGPLRHLNVEYVDRRISASLGTTSLFRPWRKDAAERGFYFLERDASAAPHFEAELARLRRDGPTVPENVWGETALVWTPEFYYDLEQGAKLQRPGGHDDALFGAMRDAFHNKPLTTDVRFRLFVDSRLSAEGDVVAAHPRASVSLGIPSRLQARSRVEFVAETMTLLHGESGRSTVRATNVGAGLHGPYIRGLQVLDSNGRPTGLVPASQATEHRVVLTAGDDIGLWPVGIELDAGSGWTRLPVTTTGEVYSAPLPPLPSGTRRAKLRVSLRDKDGIGTGNTLFHVIDPIFVTGSSGIR